MIKENTFSRILSELSDFELNNYIDNKDQFEKDAVLAAIWELEKRNKAGEKIKKVKFQIIENKRIEKEKNDQIQEQRQKESNITNDPNAPLLYNSKFILGYGAIFSVFAGGILMSMNFRKLGKRRTSWLILATALFYTILQVIILDQIGSNTSTLTVPISILGIYLLEYFFWKKQVPKDIIYRKRKIWIPLIIAIVLTISITYLMIIGGEI